MAIKNLPLAMKANPALASVSGFSELVTAWKDYKMTCEREQTARTQIAANRDVQLAAIRAQAEAMQSLISKTFDERSKNFAHCFTMLDQGFARGDDKMIDVALTMIVKQIETNPMAAAVKMINDIHNPDVKHIEF